MKGFRLCLLLPVLVLVASVNGQYWFQFGAKAGSFSHGNNGASVAIYTVTGQHPTSGSLAFWVGEDLSNGAFLQVGYVIENESGYYPSSCNYLSCSGYEQLGTGQAEWFYEYFLPDSYNTSFMGGIGPAGSAGSTGSKHTYGFYSEGNNWIFTFDGQKIGEVNLGTNNSGLGVPVAYGEIANTNNSQTYISPVVIYNLSYYEGNTLLLSRDGYSYIGYGYGSETLLSNPYGVEEVNNRSNYFEVGSYLPSPENGYQLWSIGYHLAISSRYGNVSSNSTYLAYSNVGIYAPQEINESNGSREFFLGWNGTGAGAYRGPDNRATVKLDSNVSEVADWEKQYLVRIYSYSGNVSDVWSNANSIVEFNLSTPFIYLNATAREAFTGWSNGDTSLNGSAEANRSLSIRPIYKREYFVKAYSQYGNATGSGWYANGSVATLAVSPAAIYLNNTARLHLYSWNGNYTNSSNLKIKVNRPISEYAGFRKQYLVEISGEMQNGYAISGQVQFYIDKNKYNSSAFLFSNRSYSVTGAYYKGILIPLNYTINASSPSNVHIPLPVSNIEIYTSSIFGVPVNATDHLIFANGTKVTMQSGNQGLIYLYGVPYGEASGYAEVDGIDYPINMQGGGVDKIVLVTYYDIAIFAGVAVLAFIVREVILMEFERRGVHRRRKST